jgi:polyphenol oxidase
VNIRVIEPDWPAPAGIRAISTLRAGGFSQGRFAGLNLAAHVGDDAAAVAENRRCLREAFAFERQPSWLAQVHGINVVNLDSGDAGLPADAAITRRAGPVCAILSADCLPILLTDSRGTTVAAAHAGWRGLAAGIIEATVDAVGKPGRDLLAWLGPAIGPAHFEVGAEVRDALMAGDPDAAGAFRINAQGRFMADLPGLARRRLQALGIGRIYGGGQCTFSDAARFYSYRRDGQTGRQATLIWRTGA